jgi:hypothetical protein
VFNDEDLDQMVSWLRHPITQELAELVADLLESPIVWRALLVIADEQVRKNGEQPCPF